MNKELIAAVRAIEAEKGIDAEKIFVGLENSLIAACKGIYGKTDNIRVSVDRENGDLQIIANKTVTEEPEEDISEISVEAAREIKADAQIGDIIPVMLDYSKFGRIAAQNAKNIMMQTVREEERQQLYKMYKDKERTLVTGIVQRRYGKRVSINVGKVDAMIPENEQIPGELYTPTRRMKVFISDVRMGNRGPRIIASRTHPDLIRCLFEAEVAEIKDGIVEIKSIAREAGSRTKMAVFTHDPNVDPVGACVGLNVARVNAIIEELRGEKIDIINWVDDPKLLIENALSPAQVVHVEVNEATKCAVVIVPDYQLSLAIGKEGQNARLAAKLTGYRIDIYSESQTDEAEAEIARRQQEAEERMALARAEAERAAAEAAVEESDVLLTEEADAEETDALLAAEAEVDETDVLLTEEDVEEIDASEADA
ncbi:MAG: transcription termination factor NusA [Eubacteriales bacterium]|nr:transcription termination factor NusA [Eubacteriales bacterium]